MRWLQIKLTTTKPHVTLIETMLENLGASGISLDDAADQPLLEPLPGETPIWDHVVVTGLFTDDVDGEQIIQFVQSNASISKASAEFLEEQVWERAWMDHYHPIQCGDKLWIVPEWLEPPEPNAVNLMLDPGLAFGTGDHASTFLCLQWLDKQDLTGKTVIDYGCGSGILGIAALLLGAKQVYAVDLDPQAVLSTQQNAQVNQVSDKLWVGLPDEFAQHYASLKSDVIVANILATPLMQLAEMFSSQIKPNGSIALAGLIIEQMPMVKATYQQWFNMHQLEMKDDNWCLLAGSRLDNV